MYVSAPERRRARHPLDVVSAVFGLLLRKHGVAASPAETIEVRRVFGLVGARDRVALRSCLRAVCAKYPHERAGFERAFDELFGAVDAATADSHDPLRAQFADSLPTALEIDDDPSIARYAEYNERAAEVGDHFDTPEAEKGFNPHKDDDDVSMTSSDAELSVDTGADSGRRGVTYTVDVERAGSTTVGELSADPGAAVVGSLSWDDPTSILAWLDAYDPHRMYGGDVLDGPLSEAQLSRLVDAVEAFVASLAGVSPSGTEEVEAPESRDAAGVDRAEIELACHEVLRRMRGPARPRPRELTRGRLDMRRTARAGMRTDGVPFHLVVRAPRPDRVRLLVLADVSLSVRPITAFTLRLAQAIHGRAHRCRVVAFVDRPVDVTQRLLAADGDGALAAVLAHPGVDLEASSDYGRVFDELLVEHAGSIDNRTSVLVVGDGRCNGLPARVDRLEELRRRVHRLAWITPEPKRYWAQATCAMPDYADVCDHVVVARDGEQLLSHAAELGHALR
ncbi:MULTISPECIES: MadC family VWA domain-containing protein [unclassified Rhodococcus (in: high G+C Gram-positive bacteria)]|uniref:MadC family VWA domain-containing protein n=1 Tax=Rhodococcus sp. SJ-3 TaxID=3454628 RepID=UPI002DA3FCE6|nr:VWA domain-containing protein [Rhodococcus sp. (in: high G+C Gram-positive bacteria)]